jgi:hypothetical protein
MEKEFIPYAEALALKELGFDEPCLNLYHKDTNQLIYKPIDGVVMIKIDNHNKTNHCSAPLYQQAINFLYICSNKQIDIELKGSDTYEERIRKIEQGCKDLWNLQNNKSN